MTTLGKRVLQLEGRRPAGCAICRWWDGTVVECTGRERSRPDQCPACGRNVPPTLIVQIDGDDVDEIQGTLPSCRAIAAPPG